MQPQLTPAPHMKGFAPQQQHELTQEQTLREHLLHHVNDQSQGAIAQNRRDLPAQSAAPAHNIDPAIAGSGIMSNSPEHSGGDENGTSESRKGGKRELSTSKRAAQNRAAQRAFRQRKEGHIKKLEEQVREVETIQQKLRTAETENFTLREYIISLQSRLIESQGSFPPAPTSIDLSRPLNSSSSMGSAPTTMSESHHVSTVPPLTSPMNLQRSAAQAVAGLDKDTRMADSKTDPALLGKKA